MKNPDGCEMLCPNCPLREGYNPETGVVSDVEIRYISRRLEFYNKPVDEQGDPNQEMGVIIVTDDGKRIPALPNTRLEGIGKCEGPKVIDKERRLLWLPKQIISCGAEAEVATKLRTRRS